MRVGESRVVVFLDLLVAVEWLAGLSDPRMRIEIEATAHLRTDLAYPS